MLLPARGFGPRLGGRPHIPFFLFFGRGHHLGLWLLLVVVLVVAFLTWRSNRR